MQCALLYVFSHLIRISPPSSPRQERRLYSLLGGGPTVDTLEPEIAVAHAALIAKHVGFSLPDTDAPAELVTVGWCRFDDTIRRYNGAGFMVPSDGKMVPI